MTAMTTMSEEELALRTNLLALAGMLETVETSIREVLDGVPEVEAESGLEDIAEPVSVLGHERSSLQCILADRLGPAVRGLADLATWPAEESGEPLERLREVVRSLGLSRHG